MGIIIDVGKQLLAELTVEKILEQKESWYSKHEVIYTTNRKKTVAILTVCKTGMGTSERISDVLNKSLPENVDIPVIAYDYKSLAKANRIE